MSMEAVWEGAEHGLRDAETHPPGAPGVRWGRQVGGGQAGWTRASAPARGVPSRRQAEPEQSDGEEDFYYTELDVGVDVLADGLSGLSPVCPTAPAPPAFPRLELPEPPSLSSLLRPLALPRVPLLSSAAPREVCRGDAAFRGGEPRAAAGGGSGCSGPGEDAAVSPLRAAWPPSAWSRSPPPSGPACRPCPPSLAPARGA